MFCQNMIYSGTYNNFKNFICKKTYKKYLLHASRVPLSREELYNPHIKLTPFILVIYPLFYLHRFPQMMESYSAITGDQI